MSKSHANKSPLTDRLAMETSRIIARIVKLQKRMTGAETALRFTSRAKQELAEARNALEEMPKDFTPPKREYNKRDLVGQIVRVRADERTRKIYSLYEADELERLTVVACKGGKLRVKNHETGNSFVVARGHIIRLRDEAEEAN